MSQKSRLEVDATKSNKKEISEKSEKSAGNEGSVR